MLIEWNFGIPPVHSCHQHNTEYDFKPDEFKDLFSTIVCDT